ncbi:YbaN family protein [Sphingomonas sp. LB-2]|uniref:YbaN family protein n=1 Tax=Sphingomonas caeni TaxID=2984949 RepID=UPI002230E473|nr:YbaN family protein [Sphingomonas caeni]MCW3846914.1 YbaN family protein [Sphingomonas caeni]
MRRHFYLATGFICIGLAIIGAILPLMPTTIFVILAAYCFARSSPELEARLLEHPRFGKHILLWREKGAISRTGKHAAAAAFAVSIAASLIFVRLPWSLLPVAAALIIGGWIWTRPEA